MSMQIAIYKGPPSDLWHRVSHRVICWFTGSPYSHVELVIGGESWSASSRDGGVRGKRINFGSGRWDVFDVEGDEEKALKWFRSHAGEGYDYAGLLRFVLPLLPQWRNQWFCSEAVAAALGFASPEMWVPSDFINVRRKES